MSVETRASKQEQYLHGKSDAEKGLEPSDGGPGGDKDLPKPSETEGEASGQSPRWEPPDRADGQAPPVVTRSLDSVRSSLIRQEETIIFSLIEREQFGHNPKIYADRTFRLNRKDVPDIYGRDASFLEYMLCETEKLHATGEPLLYVSYQVHT